uniref:Core-binding (CB) domain-containing protein n=1 Tax=Branchiostoma floridae TaxID=7739 RepID=C3Z1D5_BRAFL|eukprot:XP_002597541.1 hypothetical protein BRAFLDRAFT_78908 [Branchiostoma floridae]
MPSRRSGHSSDTGACGTHLFLKRSFFLSTACNHYRRHLRRRHVNNDYGDNSGRVRREFDALKQQVGALTTATQSIQRSLAALLLTSSSAPQPPAPVATSQVVTPTITSSSAAHPSLSPALLDVVTGNPVDPLVSSVLGVAFSSGLPQHGLATNSCPGTPATEGINRTLTSLRTSSLAPSTLRAYRQAWQSFRQFTLDIYGKDLASPPVSTDLISPFIAHLHNKDLIQSKTLDGKRTLPVVEATAAPAVDDSAVLVAAVEAVQAEIVVGDVVVFHRRWRCAV